jgi:hypothetical protein
MYFSKFYGSCGHIELEEISKDQFDELTKEIIVKTICGDFPHKNEISEKNSMKIVHIHPHRFFACLDCIKKEFAEMGITI